MEPIWQAVNRVYGTYDHQVATGLLLRHDHSSQLVSRDYQREVEFLGISSPSFFRSLEDNGVIERFFRALKEQLLWLREFRDSDALRAALCDFWDRYNANWILQRHGHRSPDQVRGEWERKLKMAS